MDEHVTDDGRFSVAVLRKTLRVVLVVNHQVMSVRIDGSTEHTKK